MHLGMKAGSLALCAAVLAASAAAPAHAGGYLVKHTLDGVNDGAFGLNGLTKGGKNAFYGVAITGGANGGGTVFTMTAKGAVTVLHAFGGGTDGSAPRGEVVFVPGDHDAIYGTTASGGTGTGCSGTVPSCGTVYKIDLATNAYSILYSFQGGADGATPAGGLAYKDGVLYGTTLQGGGTQGCPSTYDSCGTVFSVTTGGMESVLYSFQGGRDGANPGSKLLISGKDLFGTTAAGGGRCARQTEFPDGCGTVFKLTPPSAGTGPWDEHVLHRFQSISDGADPYAGVIKMGSVLYGTAFAGGSADGGIVYSIDLHNGNSETVVYNFLNDADGGHPIADLHDMAGTLYGVASSGGTPGCRYIYPFDGCGTVFQLVPGGIATLYSFEGAANGGNPYMAGGLVDERGVLYGTTYGGGAGYGVLFGFVL